MFVDLPAVRPARFLRARAAAVSSEDVRAFRDFLRDARSEPLPDGIRLRVRLDAPAIARLAEQVRAGADALPFWSFRLLADPPECWLEVTGEADAGATARAVFGALVA